MKALGSIVWYGVANAKGVKNAQLLRMFIEQEVFNCHADDDNIDKWYKEAVFMTSEKQILTAKWRRKCLLTMLQSKVWPSSVPTNYGR